MIKDYKTHFVDRIIGCYSKKREPVSIMDAAHALLTGTVKENRPFNAKPGNVYSTNKCNVSINPITGTLIQTTPKERSK